MKPWLTPLLLMALTCAVYLPTIDAGFVWDDRMVTENPVLRSWEGLRQIWFEPSANLEPQYYPLVHTSYWIEFQLWGLNPRGYHCVNVMLHAFSSIFVWRILRTLGVPGAWLSAAVFAVHPVHVETVAWILSRKTALSGTLYLLSVLCFLRWYRSDRWSHFAVMMIIYVLALTSKTVVCTLPIVLLIILWWKDTIHRRALKAVIPMLIIGATFGLITASLEVTRVGASGDVYELGIFERTLIACHSLVFYVHVLVLPVNLSIIYPKWVEITSYWPAYASFAVVFSASLILWAARNRIGRAPLASWAIFVITLSPALGFFTIYFMVYSYVADHYQYLASISLIALACAFWVHGARSLGRRRLVIAQIMHGSAIAVVGLLCALSWQRSKVFTDVESFWNDTLQKNPSAWIAHNNLSVLHVSRGHYEQAIGHLHEALNIFPKDAVAYYNLGRIMDEQGRSAEAREFYEQSVRFEPTYADALCNLGILDVQEGRYESARKQYVRAIEAEPRHARSHNNLALLLSVIGEPKLAITHYEVAIEIQPWYDSAHNNLGVLLADTGQPERSLVHLRAAVQHNPHNDSWRYNLVSVLSDHGQIKDALDALAQGRRALPDSMTLANYQAWLYATHPALSDALADEAIRLGTALCQHSQFKDPSFLDTLAAAFARAGRFDEAISRAIAAQTIASRSNDQRLLGAIELRLETYRKNEPYLTTLGPNLGPQAGY